MEELIEEIDILNMKAWKNLLTCNYYPTSDAIKELILKHRDALKDLETPEHLIPLHKAEITRLQSILYPPQTLAS